MVDVSATTVFDKMVMTPVTVIDSGLGTALVLQSDPTGVLRLDSRRDLVEKLLREPGEVTFSQLSRAKDAAVVFLGGSQNVVELEGWHALGLQNKKAQPFW